MPATARRRQDPGRHHRPVLRRVRADSAATGRIRAELARHGIQASALEPPEDHGRKRHDSLSTQEEGPNHHPGRGPPRPAGAGPRRNHAADAPAVTWAGDITLHPGPGKGGSPHLATVTGLHPARRSSAAPVAGHTPYRADQRGPDPWPPGSARRSGAPRCLRSDRLNLPSTPLPGTRK